MHFAIPDTNECYSGGGEGGGGGGGGGAAESYTVYNIHVNGAYHCSLRYSQLLRLHEFLTADFSAELPLPAFPSKKLFGLTSVEKEKRRLMLEKYVQEVSQSPRIAGSSLFRAFLLLAQRETHGIIEATAASFLGIGPRGADVLWISRHASNASTTSNGSAELIDEGSTSQAPPSPPPPTRSLTVWLHNGHGIKLESVADASTTEVLEMLADQIAIPADVRQFFGLFLIISTQGSTNDSDVADEAIGDFVILRELQDFEAPLLSLKVASSSSSSSPDLPRKHRVLLSRRYFDSLVDDFLMENKVTLNLLYVQVTSELDRGRIYANKDQQHHLEALRRKNSKRDFLRYARGLKFYGFRHFRPALMDYPQRDTSALLGAGDQKMVFRIKANDGSIKEGILKVQRMRCWRIVTQIVEEQQQQQQQQQESPKNNKEDESNGIKEHSTETNEEAPPSDEGDDDDNNNSNNNSNDNSEEGESAPPILRLKCELSIEYLVARDSLQWITIVTDDAIFASQCLQTMVDELIAKRETGSLKSRRSRPSFKKEHLAGSKYVNRNGKLMTTTTTTTNNDAAKKTQKSGSKSEETRGGGGEEGGEAGGEEGGGKRGSESESAATEEKKGTSLRKRKSKENVVAAPTSGAEKRENEAFGGIGEDDL